MWVFNNSESDLLNRIRNGDERAKQELMTKYWPELEKFMVRQLYNSPQQLGDASDYATDAILLLIKKASLLGAAVIKHEKSSISSWLCKAAVNIWRNAQRKDRNYDRSIFRSDDEDNGNAESDVDKLKDEGADSFADKPEKQPDDIIREVIAAQPPEVKTLIDLYYFLWLTWKQTADIMLQTYPNHHPRFTTEYITKTYWGKKHKELFRNQLTQAFRRYGYDF